MSSLTESERESLIEENWKWVVDYIDDKDAEIERLKAELQHSGVQCIGFIGELAEAKIEIERLKSQITELCDALDSTWNLHGQHTGPIGKLLKHAREATK